MSSGSPTNASTPAAAPPQISRPGSSRTMTYAALAVVVIIVLVVAVGWSAGWFGGKTSNSKGCAPNHSSVVGAGSSLVFPLMYFWSTTYHDSTVNYQAVGSTSGITAITGHTVDFGASDAPLTPAQRAKAPGLMILPESAGAVVPIYNLPGVTVPLNFTADVLAKIFTAAITNWNDPAISALNPHTNLPNATIIPVVRSDGSGTTFIFTSFLSTSSAFTLGHSTAVNWPSTDLKEPKNAGISSTVQEQSYTIGYVDINYALSNSIAYGAVKNPAGNYIHANVTNSASALLDVATTLPAPTADWYNVSYVNAPGAGDYPIVSYTYVLIYQDPGKAFGSASGGAGYTLTQAQNVADFLWWDVTVGQQYSTQLFFIPLPQSTVTYDQNELKSMTYNGAALSVCTSTS